MWHCHLKSQGSLRGSGIEMKLKLKGEGCIPILFVNLMDGVDANVVTMESVNPTSTKRTEEGRG